eukprot:1013479-Amphidinium_carterae.5
MLNEQLLKKQVAEAKDNPELNLLLEEHLEAAHAAVTAKKTNALPAEDHGASKGHRQQNGPEDQIDSGGDGLKFQRLLARRIGRGLRACASFAQRRSCHCRKRPRNFRTALWCSSPLFRGKQTMGTKTQRGTKHSEEQRVRGGAGFAALLDAPVSGVSAADMDAEEDGALELGVPAPGA